MGSSESDAGAPSRIAATRPRERRSKIAFVA